METLLFVRRSHGPRRPAQTRAVAWLPASPCEPRCLRPAARPGREDVAVVAGGRAKAALEQLVLATLSNSMFWTQEAGANLPGLSGTGREPPHTRPGLREGRQAWLLHPRAWASRPICARPRGPVTEELVGAAWCEGGSGR